MSYIIYPYSASSKNKEDYQKISSYRNNLLKNYDDARQRIYEDLLKKDIKAENFFNQENINKLDNSTKEIINSIISHLNNVSLSNNEQKVFNGDNDTIEIQKLIDKAKSMQGLEDFEKVGNLFSELESSSKFVKEELRPLLGTDNLFSISTNDYNRLKEKIELAKNKKEIDKIKENARKYFGGIIGNLGESLGILYGYNSFNKQLLEEMNKAGIQLTLSNVGDRNVNGKRSVGDTELTFTYKDGKILGTIDMSNKLTAKYNINKSHSIKLRSTTVNQLPEEIKPLYYNLISFHAKGNKKQVDLATSKETISFRRYVAALILKENLFGAFKGDNVFLFNYGSYIITMNDLLNYWIQGNGTPYVANISKRTRLNLLAEKGINSEKAESKIGGVELKVFSSLHMGNLLNLITAPEGTEV